MTLTKGIARALKTFQLRPLHSGRGRPRGSKNNERNTQGQIPLYSKRMATAHPRASSVSVMWWGIWPVALNQPEVAPCALAV
jgi:hypothetical protein